MKLLIILSTLILSLSCTKKSNPLDIKKFQYASPIKKQMWGTCWAFSTIASMESSILKQKMTYTSDLSEYHLDKFNGFNRDGKSDDPKDEWFSTQGKGFTGSNYDNTSKGVMVHLGGDYTVAASYLSGTLGAVEEVKTNQISKDSPFDSFGNTPTTGVLLKNNYKYIFPQKIQWITKTGTIEEKRTRIKNAIKEYGSVASSQYMVPKPYAMINGNEVHLNTKESSPNHAITLIGWDDDIRIKSHTGAWIVKDSDHINEETNEKINLFYIPYDDIITGKDKNLGGVIFGEVALRKENTKIYNHALHGWQYEFKNQSSIKNVYTIESNEKTQAIGFYTPASNDETQITIIRNQVEISTLKYKTDYPGFYYLPVEEFKFTKNDKIEIVQHNKSNLYSLDSSFWLNVLLNGEDQELRPQRVESRASRGESFYKKNHKWLDLTQKRDNNPKIIFKNANFPIILYTANYEE